MFDPILTLKFDAAVAIKTDTGPPVATAAAMSTTASNLQEDLTFKTLQRFCTRRDLARRLARHLVERSWSPFPQLVCNENNAREAEKLFGEVIERGLYVHEHMADITRKIESDRRVRVRPLMSWIGATYILLQQRLRPARELLAFIPPVGKKEHRKWSFGRRVRHIRELMIQVNLVEGPTGNVRFAFRQKYLDKEREIDFHVAESVLYSNLNYILSKAANTNTLETKA